MNSDKLLTAGAIGAVGAVGSGMRSPRLDEPYGVAMGEIFAWNVVHTLYFCVAWPCFLTALFVLNFPTVMMGVRIPVLIPLSAMILMVGNYFLLSRGWRWRKKYRAFKQRERFREKTMKNAVAWARQHDTSWDSTRPYRAHCEICDKHTMPRSAITIAQTDLELHYREEHPVQLPAELALPQLPTSQSFR